MQTQFKQSIHHLSDAELQVTWQKVLKDPGSILQQLARYNRSLLYDLILALYDRGILQQDDWHLISDHINCHIIFQELMLDARTASRFKKDVINTLAGALRDSYDFWQDFWATPAEREQSPCSFSFAPEMSNSTQQLLPEPSNEGPFITPNKKVWQPDPSIFDAFFTAEETTESTSMRNHSRFSMWKRASERS